MWFLLIGLIAVGLKVAEVSPVAEWSWWIVSLPFAVTVVWWMVSDSTGLTAKREQQRWQDRREKRRRETVETLRTPKAADGRRVQRHDPTVDDRR